MDQKAWHVEIDISGHLSRYVSASTAKQAVEHVLRVSGYFVKPWGKGKISVSPCDEIPIDKEINNPGDKDA